MDPTTSKNIGDFFRSNVEKKLTSKLPNQNPFALSPATRLLEKRREIDDVESGLTHQKHEFQIKMETLTQRREELARKEKMLHDSLIKFESFLKENDAKRNRAIKKAQDERRIKEMKEIEVEKLKEVLQNVTKQKENQARILENSIHYQQYLESIIETPTARTEHFSDIKDILSRFDTLTATNSELMQRSKAAATELESTKSNYQSLLENKNNEILNFNNSVAILKVKLEEIQLRGRKWQAEWENNMKNATGRGLEVGQIKMATANLFFLIKSHLNNRLSTTTDTLAQLDRIQQFIIDLSEITRKLSSSSSHSTSSSSFDAETNPVGNSNSDRQRLRLEVITPGFPIRESNNSGSRQSMNAGRTGSAKLSRSMSDRKLIETLSNLNPTTNTTNHQPGAHDGGSSGSLNEQEAYDKGISELSG